MTDRSKRIAFTILAACALTCAAPGVAVRADERFEEIQSLDPGRDTSVQEIRRGVKKGVAVVKGRRPATELPDLKFFVYIVKKGDSFYAIQARLSMDMDTIMSVNGIATASDVKPGRKLFIPNMRGIIVKGGDPKKIEALLKEQKIDREYVLGVNRSDDFNKDYLFIPCGAIGGTERSLFVGSGFTMPVARGKRTSGFGMRRNPFNNRLFEFHSGVDIACPQGSHIYPARDGKVVFAGYRGGYGRLVVVEHEHGYKSYYGHLSRILVRPGDRVSRNTMLAYSGNTGRTTGPHLHFEVHRGESAVHPGMLFRKS